MLKLFLWLLWDRTALLVAYKYVPYLLLSLQNITLQ